MKSYKFLTHFLAAGSVCVLIAGCLLRPVAITTRQFVLTPSQPAKQSSGQSQLAVGLGSIKMPDYLLRSSMLVRKGDREIEYLESSLWAERLDRLFQRALAANLESQLPGSNIRLSTWLGGDVALAVFVSVDRLDVDAKGTGVLSAHWQIETSDRRKVLKSGECSLNKSGASPFANPEAVAITLSDLTAQFSETLAHAIRDTAAPGSPR